MICLYWFHPLVWIAAKLSRQDAEYAADEAVTENMSQEERLRYGKMILFTIGHGRSDRKVVCIERVLETGRWRGIEKRSSEKISSFRQ